MFHTHPTTTAEIYQLIDQINQKKNLKIKIKIYNPENIQQLLIDLEPKGFWKLDDDWFALRPNAKHKPTPSLWNSGEDGKIQVLTELKEVLENYLKN